MVVMNDLDRFNLANDVIDPLPGLGSKAAYTKQWLQNITGKEITAIAFPYGAYSKDVLAEAKSAGFKQLLATDFIFPEDYANDAMRERFTVNPFISVSNQMIAIIKGKYDSQK